MDWAETTARRDENHLNTNVVGFGAPHIRDFTVCIINLSLSEPMFRYKKAHSYMMFQPCFFRVDLLPYDLITQLFKILSIETKQEKGLYPQQWVESTVPVTLVSVTWQHLNSLRPRQDGRHFADVFKCNFLNENAWIPIKKSLKFFPKGPINNIPALVQIMAWRRTGDKPLSEPMMTQFNDAYMCHLASMS